MDGCRMRKAVRHVLRLRGAVGQRSPRVVEYTPCGVVRCSPCETVRPTLPCRAAQALVVQTVRSTVLRGVVRQRRRARNTLCHAGDRSALATRGTCCAGPSVLVRTVRSALVVRGRLLKDRSTHLTGSLGSTQTELGPLVGGESECLGGVGQQVGHLVVHRGNGHLVTNLLA